MKPAAGNLFDDISVSALDEQFVTLLEAAGFTLERIVSTGQASPAGHWYDQDRAEWVLLLRGSAALLFEGETETRAISGLMESLWIPQGSEICFKLPAGSGGQHGWRRRFR